MKNTIIKSFFLSLLLLGGLALEFTGPVHANCKKPFSKGGCLSINKPWSRGGGLSINKVYVPEKRRIGKVKSLAEVIIPVCWGSPQDCRGMEPDKSKAASETQVQTRYPYHIIYRLTCFNRKTGKRLDVNPT